MRIKLKDLIVSFTTKNFKEHLLIKDMVYYKVIKNKDEALFNRLYHRLCDTHKYRKTGSYKGLIHLVEKIKKVGFDFNKSPIVIAYSRKLNTYVCTRGRHRICILYYLYGGKSLIIVENNVIVNIKINK